MEYGNNTVTYLTAIYVGFRIRYAITKRSGSCTLLPKHLEMGILWRHLASLLPTLAASAFDIPKWHMSKLRISLCSFLFLFHCSTIPGGASFENNFMEVLLICSLTRDKFCKFGPTVCHVFNDSISHTI